MPIFYEGVTLDVPEGVSAAVRDGKLHLSFESFTGTVSLSPGVEKSRETTTFESVCRDKAPYERLRPSSETLVKKPRTNAAITADCNSELSDAFSCAAEASAGIESTSNHSNFMFPNGGLSQDSDHEDFRDDMSVGDSDGEDDAALSKHSLPDGSISEDWAKGIDSSNTTLGEAPIGRGELTDASNVDSQLEKRLTRSSKCSGTISSSRCGPVTVQTDQDGISSSSVQEAKEMNSLSPMATSLKETPAPAPLGCKDNLVVAGEAFPFRRDAPLMKWEWQPIQATGQAPPPRWAHCAAELGRNMLLFGGDNLAECVEGADSNERLSDLYSFDAAQLHWTRCQDAPQGRAWHTGTAVRGSLDGDSDIFLVFGGETAKQAVKARAQTSKLQSLSSMLSYDPEFEVWYEAVDRGHRPCGRSGHSAVIHTVNGGGAKMLVFGGFSHGSRRFVEPELHELLPSADWAWRRPISGGRPPPGCAYHTATRLSHGRVLVFGGNDAECSFAQPHMLALSTMEWTHPTTTGDAPAARTGHAAVSLDGVRVLIYGGWDYTANGVGYDFRDDIAILDTDSWTWSRPTVMGAAPAARVGHSLVALPTCGDSVEHALFMFGGRGEDDKALGDLYMLRPIA